MSGMEDRYVRARRTAGIEQNERMCEVVGSCTELRGESDGE